MVDWSEVIPIFSIKEEMSHLSSFVFLILKLLTIRCGWTIYQRAHPLKYSSAHLVESKLILKMHGVIPVHQLKIDEPFLYKALCQHCVFRRIFTNRFVIVMH